ncbi:hypothetical protein K488DRAFT_74844 [Vararia minispora EC-137]|uniref:Uncharacterized protein n=1 Tax=Vararia minispora EC-137 TaxID=1314806 RepID=A0ACB8Q5U5_9AGAM|nr:hypothetical protein K488DRAFT_74844 [Vararia minispora EC-137]
MPFLPPGPSPPVPGTTPHPSSAGASATPGHPPVFGASPSLSAPTFVPAQATQQPPQPPALVLPNPALAQTNPDLRKKTDLKYPDANFSPEEKRAIHPRYYSAKDTLASASDPKTDGAQVPQEEARGKKRARAEDFL